MPGVELRVLVPDRWLHYGQWRRAEPPLDTVLRLEAGRVRWPWLPGAQFYLHHYPDLRRVLAEFQPEVIDLWEEPWALVSAQACWWRQRLCPTAKIVAETEQNLSKVLPPPFAALRRYVLHQADFLVGRSSEAIEVARRKGFSGPAEMVPNGVDAALFRPLDRLACRRIVFGTESKGLFVAGYVGRLVPEKGLEDLLEALPMCPERVHLVLVGDGPLREGLERRASELGISQRVRLLRGRPLEELPRVMNAIDALVLPSRTTPRWKEQFGRVIIEAHCCGTPVIGSSSGAIPDVVGAGGLIVQERSQADIATALQRLADDEPARRGMGEAGRAAALAGCTWERVAARMASVYSRLIEKDSPLTAPSGGAVPTPIAHRAG